MINDKIAQSLIKILIQKGGFTLDVVNGNLEEVGYAIAVHGREQVVDPFKSIPARAEELLTYVNDNIEFLTTKGYYLGAWWDLENDQYVYDVVMVTQDQYTAQKFSETNCQKYYFNLGTGQLISTYPDPITKLQ